MDVKTLMARYEWDQIPNETGRWVFAPDQAVPQLEEMVGTEAKSIESVTGRDVISLIKFEDGGLISYARQGASPLHTLNSAKAFKLKVWDLGLDPETLDKKQLGQTLTGQSPLTAE